jgi:hypothetical protein
LTVINKRAIKKQLRGRLAKLDGNGPVDRRREAASSCNRSLTRNGTKVSTSMLLIRRDVEPTGVATIANAVASNAQVKLENCSAVAAALPPASENARLLGELQE